MKIYRIKKTDAAILNGLRGLILSHSNHSTQIRVIDNPAFSNLGAGTSKSILPKNCNTELVHAFFKKMHEGKITSKSVKILKEYLQYAEKKDKNNEIKSDLKRALKEIFYGLFLVAGSITGFALMLLLMGMATAYAGWITFLIIPIVVVAAYGVINTLVGVLKFGFGIFSFGFQQNNTGKLLRLENTLYHCMLRSSFLPSYQEVVGNTMYATAPALDTEPPTYQQAINNAAELSIRQQTPPPRFFHHHHHHSVSNYVVANETARVYSYGH